MNTAPEPGRASARTRSTDSWVRRIARRTGAGVTLLPRGLVAVGALLAGNHRAVRRRWLRAGDAPADARGPGWWALLGQAVGCVLLGAAAWFLCVLALLGLVRGLLYGVVDSGPYDAAWGGPSLAGAWVVHAVIGVPAAGVALAGVYGLERLQRQLTRPLRGEPLPGWVVPVVLLVCVVAALFGTSFVHQL